MREGIKHEELPKADGEPSLRRRTFRGRANGVITDWRLVAYDYMDEELNKTRLRTPDDEFATDDHNTRLQSYTLTPVSTTRGSRTLPYSAAASLSEFEVHLFESPRGQVKRPTTSVVPAPQRFDERQLSMPHLIPLRPRHGFDDAMIQSFPDLSG